MILLIYTHNKNQRLHQTRVADPFRAGSGSCIFLKTGLNLAGSGLKIYFPQLNLGTGTRIPYFTNKHSHRRVIKKGNP
jgi:hypothetical protein